MHANRECSNMFAGATDRVLRGEHQIVSSVMVVCLHLNSRLLAAVGADLPCLRIYIRPRKGINGGGGDEYSATKH